MLGASRLIASIAGASIALAIRTSDLFLNANAIENVVTEAQKEQVDWRTHSMSQLSMFQETVNTVAGAPHVQYQDQAPERQVVYRVNLGQQAGAETSHQVGKSTWRMVSEFIVVKVPNGKVMGSGLVVSPDAVAFRMDRWYWNDTAGSVQTSLARLPQGGGAGDKEYYSAVEVWNYAFQHIVFDTLPRAHLACGLLQKGQMQVLVMNGLQAGLIREVCPLPQSRFVVHHEDHPPVSGSAIYLPEFRPALEMGLLQHNILKPLGKKTAPSLLQQMHLEKKHSRIVYLQRRPGDSTGLKRSVVNEEAVLEVLRATGRQVDVVVDLKNFHTDKALFADADYIVGPHGGAFSNMLFANSGTTIVEFSDTGLHEGVFGLMTEQRMRRNDLPRPVFIGLSFALGLRYVSIPPLNADTFNYDKPMSMDVEALKAFFAKEA